VKHGIKSVDDIVYINVVAARAAVPVYAASAAGRWRKWR
jgi:hypothetical protein